ncbi:O-methyltransferase [Actinoplanes sp. CA-030573]|uniref:O-methyltransferase n=1 Tax=Actinoplanes sp. CA-030573 TaxID=3239898 RepID=UPI003D91AC01
MSRLRKLNRRQAALVAAAAVLCAADAACALTGHLGLALTVLGVFLAGVVALMMLLARRLTALLAANRAAQRDVRQVLDQTQRRLLGAVEEMLLSAGDRHRELSDALAAQQKAAATGTDRLLRAQTGEIEALVQLFQGFTPRAPMPSSGGFALNPTDLLDLLHLIRTREPKLVLELGSGTSTIWIAYALQKSGGRLVSLDHDPGYAEKTRAALAAHGLTDVAEVRDAPLRPVVLDGRSFPWYDTEAVADLREVDLLLIDGPPEKTGPDARYPAMRVLEDRLADTATVVFDDAHRHDEQLALRKWVETIEGLTEEGEAPGRHAVLSYRRIVRQLSTAQ